MLKSTKTNAMLLRKTCMLLTASLPLNLIACWMSSLSSISSTTCIELESKPEISNRFCNSVIASPSLWLSCEKIDYIRFSNTHAYTSLTINKEGGKSFRHSYLFFHGCISFWNNFGRRCARPLCNRIICNEKNPNNTL